MGDINYNIYVVYYKNDFNGGIFVVVSAENETDSENLLKRELTKEYEKIPEIAKKCLNSLEIKYYKDTGVKADKREIIYYGV